MNKAGNIISISPAFAIAGGEITITCSGFQVDTDAGHGCVAGVESCRITAASPTRVLVVVPEDVEGQTSIRLESGSEQSGPFEVTAGSLLADDMHIVANPAVDPKDDSIIITRSGSRGQTLPYTLYRLESDGYLDEMSAEIMNPTGIAFDQAGNLFVTNRSDGEVCRIDRGEEVTTYATGLGVATGLAFDHEGVMYVGDRSGTIFRIPEFGLAERFAVLDPSVSTYHIAFGPDGRLYVSAPGLASHDAIHAIDEHGKVEKFVRGFGRPQGLAFDTEGNLFAAACYQGRHGIVRIDLETRDIEMYVAGNNVVGLCFTRAGEMIIATNDSIYSLPVGIKGTLLD
ncbi:MAG: gluconolaconase [Blastocatellia bacterium]|nr:gluconolaconase [Blastocatellia bacterium]